MRKRDIGPNLAKTLRNSLSDALWEMFPMKTCKISESDEGDESAERCVRGEKMIFLLKMCKNMPIDLTYFRW